MSLIFQYCPSITGATRVAVDSSPTGLTGTINSWDEGVGRYLSGRNGAYLTSGQYISFSGVPNLLSFTISCWVYVTSTSGQYIITRHGASFPNQSWYIYKSAGGTWSITATAVDGSVTSAAVAGAMLDRWTHVCGVVTPTTLSLYIDGVFKSSNPADFEINNNSLPLIIGRTNGSATDQLSDGIVDDVRIYNEAFQAENIFGLFASGPGFEYDDEEELFPSDTPIPNNLDIYLYPGDTTPSDIVLSNPLLQRSTNVSLGCLYHHLFQGMTL